jgi:Sap, sulfolipid-1-addressing protein
MGALLVQMVLYGLAAALAAPIAVVLSALILAQSKRPQASVWTLTAGAALLDVVISVIALAIYAASSAESGDAAAYLDIGLGAVFFVFGVMALVSTETPEKDAARRSRAEHIASARLPAMFVFGIVVQIINIDALAAFAVGLKEIPAADVPTGQAIVAFVVGLAVMLVGYYGPAVFAALSPVRARSVLGRTTEWIMAHSKILEVVVGLAFGVVFLAKGLQVLL